jgi:FixJ family two-component response regulator
MFPEGTGCRISNMPNGSFQNAFLARKQGFFEESRTMSEPRPSRTGSARDRPDELLVPTLAEVAKLALMEAYASASVLINARREGINFFGAVDHYLDADPALKKQDILLIVREELRSKLKLAIQRAMDDPSRHVRVSARVHSDDGAMTVGIDVLPLSSNGDDVFLISFTDERKRDARWAGQADPEDILRTAAQAQEIVMLRGELLSANHDLGVANEERRSASKEMETSKETLQSTNDALKARNKELEEILDQQSATSGTLNSFFSSSDVATLLLVLALRIRLATQVSKTADNTVAANVLEDLKRGFAGGYEVEARSLLETFASLGGRVGGPEGCLPVDERVPGMTGRELLDRLAANETSLPILMTPTGKGRALPASRALISGPVQFVEKSSGHLDLLSSIGSALDRDLAGVSAARDTAVSRVASLTVRQRQIMDLVLAGQPSKNIAADLKISQRTVDNHRAAIMKKTGSKSLAALIRLAIAAA